jgi:hypothetical protein
MTAATLEEALAAFQRLDPDLAWPSISELVIPLFQRMRPYASGFPEAVRALVPPGVSVTFAIDAGPAFTHISEDLLGRWGLPLSDVIAQAFANLERRAAACSPEQLVHEPVGGIRLRALQSRTGSASTFVLLPHALARIFGPGPQLFIAPMRDLLVSLPAGVDRGFATWLHEEFAALDPNCLAPIAFDFRDGRIALEPLGAPTAVA